MKIMVAHNRYRSGTPSGENRVVEQEREALTRVGHEVIQFERSNDEIDSWPMARKISLPTRAVWSREAHRDLSAALRKFRPDVVHLHNSFPLLSPAVLHACRNAAVPVVFSLHNYRLICAGGNLFRDGGVCHDCLKGPAVSAMLHSCYNGSRLGTATVLGATTIQRQAWRSLVSAYVFLSAAQRDLFARLDLAPDRIFVKHNFVAHTTSRQNSRDLAVIYAGRLDGPKGARLLMDGWDCYLNGPGDPALRLIVAGSGPLERIVAAWASTRPSVKMVGYVDSAKCAELLAGARAILLPSCWEEPCPLVLIEAMASGVPPIAAGHGAFAEFITSGVDGALFPPGDPFALGKAIADVDANPERFEEYGVRAQQSYQRRFALEQNLQQLLDIYRFAIANPAKASAR